MPKLCLGIPAEVVKVWREGELSYCEVDIGGVRKTVILTISEPVRPGDYVVVHAGIAISKIDESEVEETLKVWEEYIEELRKVYTEEIT